MIKKRDSRASHPRFRTLALLTLSLLLVSCLAGCRRNTKQIETLADLQGATIAAETGSVHAAAVKEHPLLADCEILYGYSNADCVAYLTRHKADGVALDYLMAQSILHQSEGLMQAGGHPESRRIRLRLPKGQPALHRVQPCHQ